MEDAMTPTVAELEKKAHEALGQVVNGCYEYQFDRDVDLVHAAIRDLAAAKVEGGGHNSDCSCAPATLQEAILEAQVALNHPNDYKTDAELVDHVLWILSRCAAPSETPWNPACGHKEPAILGACQDCEAEVARHENAAQPQGGGVDVNKLHAVFDDLLSHLSMSDRTWGPFLAKTEEMREAINALKGGGVDAGKVREALRWLHKGGHAQAISLLTEALKETK